MRMVYGGGQQHPTRLYTWTSPGDRVRNQIDYILIGKRWRTTILVTKTRPSADCGSDHQLLVAKPKIKLRQKKRRNVPVRYDIETIPQAYMVAVTNRFAALLRVAEEQQTPNELWGGEAKEVVNTATKKHVSKRKKQNQPWLKKNETLGVADERRQAKVTGDRGRCYIESECREMEKDKTNSKKAFRILK